MHYLKRLVSRSSLAILLAVGTGVDASSAIAQPTQPQDCTLHAMEYLTGLSRNRIYEILGRRDIPGPLSVPQVTLLLWSLPVSVAYGKTSDRNEVIKTIKSRKNSKFIVAWQPKGPGAPPIGHAINAYSGRGATPQIVFTDCQNNTFSNLPEPNGGIEYDYYIWVNNKPVQLGPAGRSNQS